MDKNISRSLFSTLGLTLLFFFFSPSFSFAQTTIVKGVITDAGNGETLISASVSFLGTSEGTNTDFDGNYILQSDAATDTLVVSYLGYETFKQKIKIGETQTINVKLPEKSTVLNEIVVTDDSKRYRNKNNPAVELIRKAIDKKGENRAEGYDYYEYEKYEKVVLGLSNLSDKFKNRRAFKKFQFLFENLDTTSLQGKEVLPIFLKESLADVRFRKDPKKTKEIIKADTMVTFDGYVDNSGFNQYLDNLYQNIDIYDNNITILNQQFLSPIANSAPTFYKFFIQDTLNVDGTNCIKLFFSPRNKLDILFQGDIYIAYEDNYSVKKVDMTINPKISLNWVKTLSLAQDFEKIEGEGYIQVSDEFAADFGVTKRGMGMFGKRITSNRNILINNPRPDEDFSGKRVEEVKSLVGDSDAFWLANRHLKLSGSEAVTYQKIDSLQNVKLFKRAMNVATLMLSGYSNIGPYFEIGPVNTFYSFSDLEGLRLRLGGRTTSRFSTKMEIENYVAYGFKDEEFKGYLGLSYALGDGNLHQFPVKRLRVSGQREVKIPGQELQFVQEDNLLLSFKRGTNDKYLYNTIYRAEYFMEFENHFSFSMSYKNWYHTPAGSLIYQKRNDLGEISTVNEIQTSELGLMVRWAPNEKFYQGKAYRIPIANNSPIFTIWYRTGVKGLLGGDYNYHNIILDIRKRFFLSRLGTTDAILKVGTTLGEIPYPLLQVHAANQTYSYQLQGYNLMNFLEFVSDQYASINIEHDFNGFFLNRVPLIRRLKWREALNIRVLYGGLSDRNDPALTDGLIFLPTDENGNTTTFSLEDKPYIEGSIALGNIFKFFRVDLVRRFTYLENPNVTKWGVRARFRIYF